METAIRSVSSVRFQKFEFDLRTHELYRNGYRLKVRGHPVDVLAILLEHPGEMVTREVLQKRIWPDESFLDFEQSLNNSVGKLRDALGDRAKTPKFIETLPRLGYRFIASIETAANNNEVPARAIPDTSAFVLTTEPATQPRLLAQPKKSKRWITWPAAAVLVALLGCGLWYLRLALSPLRVTKYEQITLDYRNKMPVGTDGARLYLNLDYQPQMPAQVPVSGGEVEVVPVALPGSFLMNVSSDGSSLLVRSRNNARESIWSVQVPGYASRRLLDDVRVSSASWSPDRKLVAYCTMDGNIYVMRSDGTESTKLVSAPAHLGYSPTGDLSWSPDGSKIRFTWDRKLWEMSSSGSKLHSLLPVWHPSEWQCCGRWTADGRFFVFLLSQPLVSNTGSATPSSQIWALDERRAFLRSTHPEPVQLTFGPIRWGPPIPNKDGKRVFSRGVNLRGELVRFDAQSRELKPYLSGISAELVRFSPDGKFLAYVTFPEGILWKANRDGSNPIQLTDPPLYPTLLRWSPDGRQILFSAANSEGLLKMYVMSSQGGEPQMLLPSDKRFQGASDWSPDGTKIVFVTRETADFFAQSSISILDLANGQVADVPGSKGFSFPSWSPDGRYILGLTGLLNTDYFPGSLAVFDFRTQRWMVIKEGEVGYPTWSHDGKFIYFFRPNVGVFRIRPTGGEVERIADLRGFRYTGRWRYYMGLDPEDAPLLLRDTGTDDIFALTLDKR